MVVMMKYEENIRSRRNEKYTTKRCIFEGRRKQYLLTQAHMRDMKIVPQH
jgi:hypothetical protein